MCIVHRSHTTHQHRAHFEGQPCDIGMHAFPSYPPSQRAPLLGHFGGFCSNLHGCTLMSLATLAPNQAPRNQGADLSSDLMNHLLPPAVALVVSVVVLRCLGLGAHSCPQKASQVELTNGEQLFCLLARGTSSKAW